MLLPDRCSVKEYGKDCVNPPEYVISVQEKEDEYMIAVTCQKHKEGVYVKIKKLQEDKKIPKGKIKFHKLKSVGTDCIRSDPENFMQL